MKPTSLFVTGYHKFSFPGLLILTTGIILCSLTLLSCTSVERTVVDVKSFQLAGVMHYNPVEGGCWQFLADNGETYELTGEKVLSVLRDGLRLEIMVRGPLHIGTVCQTGKVVELLQIIRITQPK